MIKRATKRSWDVLHAVTSWQERSKDVEQTLKLCFFLAFRAALTGFVKF